MDNPILKLAKFPFHDSLYPANIYLFKVNNRNSRKRRNMLKVINNNTRTTSLLTLNIFHTIF